MVSDQYNRIVQLCIGSTVVCLGDELATDIVRRGGALRGATTLTRLLIREAFHVCHISAAPSNVEVLQSICADGLHVMALVPLDLVEHGVISKESLAQLQSKVATVLQDAMSFANIYIEQTSRGISPKIQQAHCDTTQRVYLSDDHRTIYLADPCAAKLGYALARELPRMMISPDERPATVSINSHDFSLPALAQAPVVIKEENPDIWEISAHVEMVDDAKRFARLKVNRTDRAHVAFAPEHRDLLLSAQLRRETVQAEIREVVPAGRMKSEGSNKRYNLVRIVAVPSLLA